MQQPNNNDQLLITAFACPTSAAFAISYKHQQYATTAAASA
jgi:hypothetical protein